jgi:polysaccharide pyruvyl transferase WcaK-like protein
MKLIIEKNENTGDDKIIKAFENMIKLYPDEDIETMWEDIKKCNFQHHKIGRGGNHIWIARNTDNQRIAMLA